MIPTHALGKRYRVTWMDPQNVKHGITGVVTEVSDRIATVNGQTIAQIGVLEAQEVVR